MKIWTKEDITEAMKNNSTNPFMYGERELEYAKYVQKILADHFPKNDELIGCEIGCGTGRLLFHLLRLKRLIKFINFEGNELLKKRSVVPNMYCHQKDFLTADVSIHKNQINFFILDGHEFTPEEIPLLVKQIQLMGKKDYLLICTGDKENIKILKRGLDDFSFISRGHLLSNDPMIQKYFEEFQVFSIMTATEKDYLSKQLTFGAKVPQVESELNDEQEHIIPEDETLEEILDRGESVTLSKEVIMSLKNKKEIEDIFIAIEKPELFDKKKRMIDLKRELLEITGWSE